MEKDQEFEKEQGGAYGGGVGRRKGKGEMT